MIRRSRSDPERASCGLSARCSSNRRLVQGSTDATPLSKRSHSGKVRQSSCQLMESPCDQQDHVLGSTLSRRSITWEARAVGMGSGNETWERLHRCSAAANQDHLSWMHTQDVAKPSPLQASSRTRTNVNILQARLMETLGYDRVARISSWAARAPTLTLALSSHAVQPMAWARWTISLRDPSGVSCFPSCDSHDPPRRRPWTA